MTEGHKTIGWAATERMAQDLAHGTPRERGPDMIEVSAEAIAMYERTLADCERVLGSDHPRTKVVRGELLASLTGKPAQGLAGQQKSRLPGALRRDRPPGRTPGASTSGRGGA